MATCPLLGELVVDRGPRDAELLRQGALICTSGGTGAYMQGSRQFKDFDEYLVSLERFASLKLASELPLFMATDCEQYLHDRLLLLEQELAAVNRMAANNDLPDAIITASGLKITPLDAIVPDAAQVLIDQTAMQLPHVKITEMLMEVDEWTDFTRHFTPG